MDLLSACLDLGVSWATLFAATGPSFFQSIFEPVWNITKVILGLGFVIFVHELGHFLAAKACGVKVEKFYVGFDAPISIGPFKLPPRLFRFQRGETEYGIGTIPLGGYVRMLGQDDDPRNADSESERIRTGPEGELDPRSFPAKPVWQRMIIISAGVVMNLIFAVIFAALAFSWGVQYTPTLIGTVTPGDPAWNAGVLPGGKIVTIGTIENDENLYFRDMRFAVIAHGLKAKSTPLPLAVKYPDGTKTFSIVPTQRHDPEGQFSTIGVMMVSAAQLPISPRTDLNSKAMEVLKDDVFEGAKILAINDQPLPKDPETDQYHGAAILLAQQTLISQPIRLRLELQSPDGKREERSVEIAPQLEKTLGLLWSLAPVSGVFPGSPADIAGLKIGDQIVAANGQTELDAIGLWRLLHRTDEELRLTVVRSSAVGSGSEKIDLKLTPRTIADDPGMQIAANTLGVLRWGIAFAANARLSGFLPPVGDLKGVAIQSGDIIKKLKVLWKEGQPPESMKGFLGKELSTESLTLDERHSPVELADILQRLPVGTDFRILFERDQKIMETTLTSREVPNEYWPYRGIVLAPLMRTHRVASVGEAIGLGFRETRNKIGEVFDFLKMIFTGKVSRKMVGGPISIAVIANNEAAEGIPRLLLFLTLLSANLAILNFLPIPVLDGGHMVFLTAELIRGRPLNEQLQFRLTLVGLCGLLALMLFVCFNDITHLIGG